MFEIFEKFIAAFAIGGIVLICCLCLYIVFHGLNIL